MGESFEFKRGLDPKQLNDVIQFLNTEIGEIISINFNFNLCIRNNYINIYWYGRSLLKYTPNTKPHYSIHHKYMGPKVKSQAGHSSTDTPLQMVDGDLINPETNWKLSDLMKKPDKLTEPEFKYMFNEQPEKEKISRYFRIQHKKLLLLDLSIKINEESHTNNKSGRIDAACLDLETDKPVLKFINFKLDKDHGKFMEENSSGVYKIEKEMDNYFDLLNSQKQNITESYQKIAKNYLILGLMENRSENYIGALKKFIDNPFVDTKPYLQIIGDKEKLEKSRSKNYDVWGELEKLFGDHFLKEYNI